MRVSLVTKINKFVHNEIFNAVDNTCNKITFNVICSKTKSTGVKIVHCQRLPCFGGHVCVLEKDTNMHGRAYISL